MIDDYQYNRHRRRFLGEAGHGVRVLLAAVAGAMLIALQIVALVLTLTGSR